MNKPLNKDLLRVAFLAKLVLYFIGKNILEKIKKGVRYVRHTK